MTRLLKNVFLWVLLRLPRRILPLERLIKALAHLQWLREEGETAYRYRYPLRSSDLVLDVGGYEGDFAGEIFKRYGCKLWIFEPMAIPASELEARFGRNERVKLFHFGLAGRDHSALMSVEGAASSAFRLGARRRRVEFKEASKFLRGAKVRKIRLFKLNIEGMEYEVIDSLYKGGWLKHIDYLQIQFHEFVPGARPLLDEVRRKLVKTHDLEWSFPWIWESWRRRA